MKLWEVLKELHDNPNKVFRSGMGRDIEHEITLHSGFYAYCRYKNGKVIEGYPSSNGFNGNASVNQHWEEVKRSVPWDQALDAWVNHKTIKCKIAVSEYVFKRNPTSTEFVDQDGYGLNSQHITDGKWYIEGDN